MIEAKAICDSIAEHSPRLMTMLWRYPKFLHQESLRHRKIYIHDNLALDADFSFSVSSSRAIPFAKLLEEVRSDELRAAPEYWGAEQKGMSPGEELSDEVTIDGYKVLKDEWKFSGIGNIAASNIISKKRYVWERWKAAALDAAVFAENLSQLGVHKSICNRIIEPYIHVNCLATATEPGWMNFFGLRLDKAADPTLRMLAEAAWKVWCESQPQKLKPGQWHLPFIDEETLDQIWPEGWGAERGNEEGLIRVSVARCARLSYMSFETQKRSTIKEDLALYQRLVGSVPIHASPAEHQATPDDTYLIYERSQGNDFGEEVMYAKHPEQGGNLGPGWRQYRKMLPGEAVAPLPEGIQ